METAISIKSVPLTEVASYKPFNRFSALAAVLSAAIIIIQFVVVMVAPPPFEGAAVDWFNYFQESKIAGLLGFEFSMVIYALLSIPVALALYMKLKNVSPSFTILYVALNLVCVLAFVAARPVFEMMYLSDGYAAAATDAQRNTYLTIGQSLVTTFHGTAFHVSYVLGSLSGLIISIVMLKSRIFSKKTAYLRIASSVCDFGLYVPVIGMYISMFSVVFLFIWNILIARKLLQPGR